MEQTVDCTGGVKSFNQTNDVLSFFPKLPDMGCYLNLNIINKLSFLVAVLCCFLGCTNEVEKHQQKSISLNPDNASEIKELNFVKEVSFLKLSNTQDAYIGSIWNIRVTQKRIYLLDSFNSLALFVYDRKGDLLFKIDNYGRGPGEFMAPYSFAVDEYKDEIIIFDGSGRKLCFYSIDNGLFIREKPLKYEISRFEVTENKYVFFLNNSLSGSSDYNIIITDKNFSIVEEHLQINPDMLGYHLELPVNFSKYDNSFFFTAPSDYHVYRINTSEEMFEKYLYVDFGEESLPSSYFEHHETNESRRNEIGESANSISNYFESDTFRFFKYVVGTDKHYFYLKSKKTGQKIHVNYDQFNRASSFGPLLPWPSAVIGNTLVWYQNPSTLFNFLKKKQTELPLEEWERFKKKNEKLISFSKTIDKKDNPYLIFMEIDF